jgi:hypothetical protein
VRRWLGLVLLVGCDGTLEEKPSQGNVDASGLTMVPTPSCDPGMAANGDGHHNPGQDCLSCHYQGGTGPPYTFAGTLYGDSGGSMPLAGATIHMIDAADTDVVVVTAQNGNFFSTDTVQPPVVAFASACPNIPAMIAYISTTDTSCNTSGCHTDGFRVHVP